MTDARKAPPEFARRLAENITRWAADYANEITAALRVDPGDPAADGGIGRPPKTPWAGADEASFLERFEISLDRALDRYHPHLDFLREMRLAFQAIYDDAAAPAEDADADEAVGGNEDAGGAGQNAADPGAAEDRRAALLAATLAGLVEATSPLRLPRKSKERLAGVLQAAGGSLRRDGLPLHAAKALDQAATLFGELAKHKDEDDCRYEAADARRVAMPRGWPRRFQGLSRAFVGYSHRPFRLLRLIGAEVLVSCLTLEALPADHAESRYQTLFVGLQNLINPMGVGDSANIQHSAWILLTAESYLGAISTDVFFALLISKWWRK